MSRAEVHLQAFPIYDTVNTLKVNPSLAVYQQTRTNRHLARETLNPHRQKRPDTGRIPLYTSRGVHTTQDRPAAATNGNKDVAMDTEDVLLMLYAVERDEQWEAELLQKIPGKLRVRWEDTRKPDGSIKAAEELDPKIFEGVTMLFTYAPVPADLVPRLRFVQLSSAGSDLWQSHARYLDSNVKFATTSGSNT